MKPLTVVIADDSFLIREGVRRLLSDGPDVQVIGDAATAPELVARVRELRPEAVLTDIRMPPRQATDGIEAALQIRAELPQIGVAVLSQHADVAYTEALFRDGTAGLAYLLKEWVGDREELVRALRCVASGGSVVDARIVDGLLAARRQARQDPLRTLTERELDVLRLMAEGRVNRAIADALHVSESAVSKHVTAIFHKLGLAEDDGIDRRVRAVLTFVSA